MPLTVEHGLAAIAVARSSNEKIGDAATTYAAQTSCPSSCAFFAGGGCYAENGRIYSGVTGPLNLVAERAGLTALDVAVEEAAAIDALDVPAGRPLRLHTVGDCRTEEAARVVAGAADRYMARGGGPVWTYTHAWRVVDRASWGRVSVLASCETPAQVELARGRGYAPSIVLEAFAVPHRYDAETGFGTVDVLPCPAQTKEDVTCSSCRLCLDDGALAGRGYAIAFEVHGTASSVKAARKALRSPSDTQRRLSSRDHALRLLAETGRWPTVRELMAAADVGAPSAREMLERLRREREAA